MSEEGCSADAALDAGEELVAEESGHGFVEADGTGHFSVELGTCDFDSIQEKVEIIDRACCRLLDADDTCDSNGELPIPLCAQSMAKALMLHPQARRRSAIWSVRSTTSRSIR